MTFTMKKMTVTMKKAVGMVAAAFLAAAVLGSGTANAHAVAAGSPAAGGDTPQVRDGPVKGSPPTGSGPRAQTSDPAAGINYFYGTARLWGPTDGAFGSYTVAQPYVAPTDSHSLAELSVSAGTSQNTIEVGWTVDPTLNGDARPHLFVYHWVDGKPIGYNGFGFVQTAATGGPGTALVPGSIHLFMIEHFQGNWWIGDNDWIGYFPDALWPQGVADGANFTRGTMVQWFGEVASPSGAPCSQMGNGKFAANAEATRIENMAEFNGPTTQPSVFSTLLENYSAIADGFRAIRFGGPSVCPATTPVIVPHVIGEDTVVAEGDIARAGLKVGTVGSVVDADCSRFNQVISQTPNGGTGLIRGHQVNIVYSSGPRGGCQTE